MYPLRISSVDISSHYQDISYNILTLLYRPFMKFVSFRKIKDQRIEMGVIMILTQMVLITSQN